MRPALINAALIAVSFSFTFLGCDDAKVELRDAIDPAAGGDCKFRTSTDYKHCSMICDTFSVQCTDSDGAGDGIAECNLCSITGCVGFKTDGCDPETWP